MRYIAYLTGNPSILGHTRREFKWRPEHNCYVWQGRSFDEKEFNAVVPVICKKYRDYFPMFRVLEEAVLEKAPVIDVPVDITVDQAVQTLEKLAPEKLRKPTKREPVPA